MPEQDFTNREISAMFDVIKEGNDRIEHQTTMHNGRMTKIERWQAYITGAFSILTLIVVPILGWALYTIVQLPNTMQHTIQKALSVYEVPDKK